MEIADRLAALDWLALGHSLRQHGHARTAPVLTPDECADLVALYGERERFRSRVEMERFRFGVGDYQYFAAPLPPLVEALRLHAYPPLAAVANEWEEALGVPARYPTTLAGMKALCRQHGQTKPTPLLLHYEAGGYNCLHQDIYGEVVFPLQLTCFLSRPGIDYDGGEFLLVEQRPRAQSRGEVLTPAQGEIVIFATRWRPVEGARGWHRVALRHGVATVRRGRRYTLGIIFHDAK